VSAFADVSQTDLNKAGVTEEDDPSSPARPMKAATSSAKELHLRQSSPIPR